jgi:hypothetical protein
MSGQPNNGMHPTGESGNVIRQIGCLSQCFPAGDAGRSVVARPLMRVESEPLVPRLNGNEE